MLLRIVLNLRLVDSMSYVYQLRLVFNRMYQIGLSYNIVA